MEIIKEFVKRILNSIKRYPILSGIVVIVSIPMVVNRIMITPAFWKISGTEDDWISFYGSYIGGIVGALVAYLIMKLEIKNIEKQTILQDYEEEYYSLVKIRFEVERIQKGLNRVLKIVSRYSSEQGCEEDEFNLLGFELLDIDNENWKNVYLSDSQMHIDLLKIKDFYKRLRESLKFEIKIMELRLKNLQIQEKSIKASGDINSVDKIIQGCQIFDQITSLEFEIEDIKLNRSMLWDELIIGQYDAKVLEMLERIEIKTKQRKRQIVNKE